MTALALAFLLATSQPTPPGTLLTFTATPTWVYTDETGREATGTSQAKPLHLVVVQPNARPVYVATRGYVEIAPDVYRQRDYEPLLDGWPVVVAVKPLSPWGVGGTVRGIQLRGGGVLTVDGRVLAPAE